jgi:hypothetical protein
MGLVLNGHLYSQPLSAGQPPAWSAVHQCAPSRPAAAGRSVVRSPLPPSRVVLRHSDGVVSGSRACGNHCRPRWQWDGGGGCDSDGVVAGGRSGGYRWMWLAASATSILLFILPLRNTADLQLPVPILAPIHNLQLSPQFYFVRRSSKV